MLWRFLFIAPLLVMASGCSRPMSAPHNPAATAVQHPSDTAVPWVPIPVAYPAPVFTGTPRDLFSPNLEAPLLELPPPPEAPPGIGNLALGRAVIASVPAPLSGELAMVTDGDKEARPRALCELEAGPQYLQIDLGKQAELFAVLLWHYHAEPRIYFDVVVQASDDPDFAGDAITLFNNDHDNTLGLGAGRDKEYIETYRGKAIPAQGAKARYLRCWSNGNTANALNACLEIEAWGR